MLLEGLPLRTPGRHLVLPLSPPFLTVCTGGGAGFAGAGVAGVDEEPALEPPVLGGLLIFPLGLLQGLRALAEYHRSLGDHSDRGGIWQARS